MAAILSLNLAIGFKGVSIGSSSSISFLRGNSGSFSAGHKVVVSVPMKSPLTIESAHKKGAGSTKNGRDSPGQRLGVKIYGDQLPRLGPSSFANEAYEGLREEQQTEKMKTETSARSDEENE